METGDVTVDENYVLRYSVVDKRRKAMKVWELLFLKN